jgi:transketolase
MIEGISKTLDRALRDEPRTVLLYADALPNDLEAVCALAGDRAINVGIAEATLVSLAGGLAASGMCPVVLGLASFLASRAYAQLRQDVALDGLPVTLVGFAAGSTLAEMGPTHCTLDDLGLISLLPAVDIALANDSRSAAHLLSRMLASGRCGYLRVEAGRGDTHAPLDDSTQRLCDGTDATIICHGAVTHDALRAAVELAQEGLAIGVVSVLRLRPLDLDPLRASFRVGPVLVVEEHLREGGLGSMLGHSLTDFRPAAFAHLTPRAYSEPSAFAPGEFRVSVEQIREAVKELIAHPQPCVRI